VVEALGAGNLVVTRRVKNTAPDARTKTKIVRLNREQLPPMGSLDLTKLPDARYLFS
jgi:hypothetical protein